MNERNSCVPFFKKFQHSRWHQVDQKVLSHKIQIFKYLLGPFLLTTPTFGWKLVWRNQWNCQTNNNFVHIYRRGKRFNDDFVFERIWAIQWILVALSCDPVDLSLRYFVSKFVWAWINVNDDGDEIYALLACVNNSFIVVILCFS